MDDTANMLMVANIRQDFDAAVTTWLSYDEPDDHKAEINAMFHSVGLTITEERDAAIAVGARMCSSLLQAFAHTIGRDAQEFWREILIDAAAQDAAEAQDQELEE